MSNEKRSDSWISELNALEALPGEAPFDKAVAWDRLHQRMNGKRAKKRVIWYWAAACLLLACMTLFFLHPGHKTQFPSSASYVEHPYKEQIREDGTNGKDAPAIVKAPGIPPPADIHGSKKPVPVRERKATIIPDVTVIIPPVIRSDVHPDTMLAETTAVAVVPRKMRVVHINEVGGDVIGNAYVYPEHKQFKIGLSGPAGFASQVVADKSSKTTSSPTN